MLYSYEYISKTSDHVDALNLILEASIELHKKGFNDYDYGVEVKINDQAFILKIKNKVVGIITFYDCGNSYWINLSYVKPKYRGRGAWSRMREVLKEYASDKGKEYVLSGVNINNVASLKANAKIAQPIITMFKQKV